MKGIVGLTYQNVSTLLRKTNNMDLGQALRSASFFVHLLMLGVAWTTVVPQVNRAHDDVLFV